MILISGRENGDITAHTYIPSAVPIIKTDTTIRTGYAYGDAFQELCFNITFTDIEHVSYYMLVIKAKEQIIHYEIDPLKADTIECLHDQLISTGFPDVKLGIRDSDVGIPNSNEIVLDDLSFYEDDDRYHKLIIADDLFKNNTITITLKGGSIYDWKGKDTAYIYLYSLNEDTYKYFSSLALYQATTEDMFSETMNVFSNINNGLGIFSSYNIEIDSIELCIK